MLSQQKSIKRSLLAATRKDGSIRSTGTAPRLATATKVKGLSSPHLTLRPHRCRRQKYCWGVAGSARWGDIKRSCHFITDITEWERLKEITPRRLGCIDRFSSAADERSDGIWPLVCVWERAINKIKSTDDEVMRWWGDADDDDDGGAADFDTCMSGYDLTGFAYKMSVPGSSLV